MTFLLLITAALVGASGALKVRSTARVGLGTSPLAILELAVAVALIVLVLPGPLSGTAVARWAPLAALAILVVSSVDHGSRLGTFRRRRAESEGGRLAAYVKYLSEAEDVTGNRAEGTDGSPGGGGREEEDRTDMDINEGGIA